jgi:2-dehydro-3-deoxyphosphogluconate aldolase/(4S)-4-hydroxy-2-oxoglutarate aldolase
MKTIELAKFGPVIPVIVIDRVEDAVPVASSLIEGGVKVLEVTLRSQCALQVIEEIATKVPEAVIGAGSQFAVSPGYTFDIGQTCKDVDLPLLPGVSTGSEVMKANADGFDFLKLFPAVAVGGINLLKGFAGPFADISFCPTGGITIKTAKDFLALPNVPVCGGTWLTPKDLIQNKQWGEITKLAKEASSI